MEMAHRSVCRRIIGAGKSRNIHATLSASSPGLDRLGRSAPLGDLLNFHIGEGEGQVRELYRLNIPPSPGASRTQIQTT